MVLTRVLNDVGKVLVDLAGDVELVQADDVRGLLVGVVARDSLLTPPSTEPPHQLVTEIWNPRCASLDEPPPQPGEPRRDAELDERVESVQRGRAQLRKPAPGKLPARCEVRPSGADVEADWQVEPLAFF